MKYTDRVFLRSIMQENQNKRDIGNIGENYVCGFLVRNGYEIVKRNFTVRGGEIDIIAKKNGDYAFVEVKTRDENSLTTGEQAITYSKKKHLVRTAEIFLERLEEPAYGRFDVAVIILKGTHIKKLTYYVSAFTIDN